MNITLGFLWLGLSVFYFGVDERWWLADTLTFHNSTAFLAALICLSVAATTVSRPK